MAVDWRAAVLTAVLAGLAVDITNANTDAGGAPSDAADACGPPMRGDGSVGVSFGEACLLALAVLVPFVGLFYASPSSISSLPRDDPWHVMYRMGSIVASSAVSTAFFWAYTGVFQPACYGLVVHAADPAFWWAAVAMPLLLVLTLYFAEVAQRLAMWYKTGDAQYTLLVNVDTGSAVLLARNLVFAPVIEEYTFRCLIVRAFQMVAVPAAAAVAATQGGATAVVGLTTTQLVFLPSLFFSAAHVHHIYRLHWLEGHPLGLALVNILLMCTYTYLFGTFATFLLLHTGTAVAPIVAHVACNFLGLPSLACFQQGHLLFQWRFGILALHLVSIAAFAVFLYTLASGWE